MEHRILPRNCNASHIVYTLYSIHQAPGYKYTADFQAYILLCTPVAHVRNLSRVYGIIFFSRRRRLPMVKHTGPYMVVSGGRTVNITTSIRENELACVYRAYQVPQ